MFNVVMRMLLSWVMVRENQSAHTDRPGRQWPAGELLRWVAQASRRRRIDL
jgi:hypothetical protein